MCVCARELHKEPIGWGIVSPTGALGKQAGTAAIGGETRLDIEEVESDSQRSRIGRRGELASGRASERPEGGTGMGQRGQAALLSIM